MQHKKKILPAHFQAVREGLKTFEIRDNSDCGYQKGDTVTLQEFDPEMATMQFLSPIVRGQPPMVGRYTGASIDVEITYVSNYMQKENYVVFGFKVCDDQSSQA